MKVGTKMFLLSEGDILKLITYTNKWCNINTSNKCQNFSNVAIFIIRNVPNAPWIKCALWCWLQNQHSSRKREWSDLHYSVDKWMPALHTTYDLVSSSCSWFIICCYAYWSIHLAVQIKKPNKESCKPLCLELGQTQLNTMKECPWLLHWQLNCQADPYARYPAPHPPLKKKNPNL